MVWISAYSIKQQIFELLVRAQLFQNGPEPGLKIN